MITQRVSRAGRTAFLIALSWASLRACTQPDNLADGEPSQGGEVGEPGAGGVSSGGVPAGGIGAAAGEPGAAGEPAGGLGGTSADTTISIATFNIRDFGPTKIDRPEVVEQLAEIIRRYPLVAVQEISDVNQEVPYAFLSRINESSRQYGMLLSLRSGQQPDDRTYQEQYAFYYDASIVEPLSAGVLYEDSANDWFVREPYVARFSVTQGGFTFVAITVHTQPDTAVGEIAHLDDVVQWAKALFPEEDDFVILGDLNAGCSYASPIELDMLSIRGSDYIWIVPDDADTNLAMSECAYDRIVLTSATRSNYAETWGIDRSFTDTVVSDHWPRVGGVLERRALAPRIWLPAAGSFRRFQPRPLDVRLIRPWRRES